MICEINKLINSQLNLSQHSTNSNLTQTNCLKSDNDYWFLPHQPTPGTFKALPDEIGKLHFVCSLIHIN